MAKFFIPNKSVGDHLNAEDFRIRGYSKIKSEYHSLHLLITRADPLTSPELLQHTIPQTEKSKETVLAGRNESVEIVGGKDPKNRLLVVVGPCSIHDPQAALDYCDRLVGLKKKYEDDLLIVMRSYLCLLYTSPSPRD